MALTKTRLLKHDFPVHCKFRLLEKSLKNTNRPQGLRSRRPGTGPENGNSRKVLAGVLAQVLAKMGVLARLLAQVLAGCFVSVFPKGPTCQHLCQHSSQHPHFCQHLCQHPRQHFSGIPIFGSCTRSPGSQRKDKNNLIRFSEKVVPFLPHPDLRHDCSRMRMFALKTLSARSREINAFLLN